MIPSQLAVYQYIREDCGGSKSAPHGQTLAYIINKEGKFGDEDWVQVILDELVERRAVTIRANAVEVEEVDPVALDDGDVGDDEGEAEPVGGEAVPAPEVSPPTAVVEPLAPSSPVGVTASSASIPARKVVSAASDDATTAPPDPRVWTSASARSHRGSARPPDDPLTRARMRAQKLETQKDQLRRRLELAQSRTAKAVEAAEAERRLREEAETRVSQLSGQLEQLQLQFSTSAQQVIQERAAAQEQLDEALATQRDQALRLTRAEATEHKLRDNLEQQRREITRLTELNQSQTATITARGRKIQDQVREIAHYRELLRQSDEHLQLTIRDYHRLEAVLERFRAQRTLSRKFLICGHMATTLVDPGHDPDRKDTCSMLLVMEQPAGLIGLALPPADAPRQAQPNQPSPQLRRKKRRKLPNHCARTASCCAGARHI